MANQTSVDDDERNARAHEQLTDAVTAASEEYLLAACRRISMARMTQSATSCDLDYAVFFLLSGCFFTYTLTALFIGLRGFLHQFWDFWSLEDFATVLYCDTFP